MVNTKCPNCGYLNPLKATFCSECGTSLDDGKIVCPNCGELNDRKAKFCMNCATKLTEETPQNEEKSINPNDDSDNKAEAQEINELTEIGETEINESSDVDDKFTIPSTDNEDDKDRLSGKGIPFGKINSSNDPAKKSKKLFIGIAAIAILAIIGLYSALSSPKIEKIEVSYDGETVAGTVLNNENEGIKVKGFDKDGNEHEITGWSVENEQTLKMDSSSTVKIAYKDLTKDLTVACSTSELISIDASYSGDASEGVVLDSDNDGFTVTAYYKNGEEEVVDGWSIEEPQTLVADGTADVVIQYEDQEYTLNVMCTTVTIDKITAKYSGSTKAGVKIGEGSNDVTVTAVLKNGEKQEVSGWTVDEPVTLKEGQTSKLKIHYGEYDCTLKVECTDLSKKQYKEKCKTYTYNEIARDPDDYEGKKAKFSGEVLQCLESSDSSQVNIRLAINDDYDQVLYVVYDMPKGSSRILEDDHITVYGELAGLYTYTSTMNAQITIPIMYAEYVDLKK